MNIDLFRAAITQLPIDRRIYWLVVLWWETHHEFLSLDSVRIAALTFIVGIVFLPSVPLVAVIILCLICLIAGILIGYALARRDG